MSGPIASGLDASAKAIDLAQNRPAILRRFDLRKAETCFVAPVASLGGGSGRVLWHGFGPEAFEVDQE